MNFIKDIFIIFLLFVVGDIFTTWLGISTGMGVESKPWFVEMVNGGFYGYLLFFILKLVALIIISIPMIILIKLEMPKIYVCIRNTVYSVSFFIVLSNFSVIFIGQNIFELIGI